MRSSIICAAPILAVAYAQSSSEAANNGTAVVPVLSGSSTVTSTYTYSNGFTSFLTETNSLGVVTGMPEVATSQSALPTGVSTQPEVATIPAGLASGTTVIIVGNGTAMSSFTVDVGSSTTNVLGANAKTTSVGVVTATAGVSTGSNGVHVSASKTSAGSNSKQSGSSASGSGSSDSDSSSTATSSSASSSSSSAAMSNVQFASAGLFGFGALAALFL